jgi:oxygen-independent coproporphyrinogen-3 oxidase
VSNNALYIQSLSKDQVPFEMEELTEMERLNEYIMTSLRTMEGLSLADVHKKWSKKELQQILEIAQKPISLGLMVLQDQKLILTNAGKLMADGIASDLFFI